MAERINLDKTVYLKENFKRLVDSNFNFFIQNTDDTSFTISDFFKLYEQIFEFIPREGDVESHRYILNKEAEYLEIKTQDDSDLQVLLDEITKLRRELLDNNNTILELTK
jgi:hypothetical protein